MKSTTQTNGREPVLIDRLAAFGWAPGVPAGSLPDVVGADAEAGADSECPSCGGVGLAVLPLRCGARYGLLLCCVRCHYTFEG